MRGIREQTKAALERERERWIGTNKQKGREGQRDLHEARGRERERGET